MAYENILETLEGSQDETAKVIGEYEKEFQSFVLDIHKDVHNKFSHYDEFKQDLCSVSVMHYLLFNQICRAISNIGGVRNREGMFDYMGELGREMCEDWAELLSKEKES